jgi:hypothetical protein
MLATPILNTITPVYNGNKVHLRVRRARCGLEARWDRTHHRDDGSTDRNRVQPTERGPAAQHGLRRGQHRRINNLLYAVRPEAYLPLRHWGLRFSSQMILHHTLWRKTGRL